MYSSYTAATFARIWDLADRHKVNLEGVLTWAFTFEDQPWFAGYRQLATNGVDLPVLNVFRMFSMMGEDRLGATSDHAASLDDMIRTGVRGAPDVNVLASRGKDGRIAIMLWNYHDDDVPGPTANVKVALTGLDAGARDLVIWRVDQDNANAFTAWKAMGSPQSPDQNQYKVLEEASKMKPEAGARVTPAGGAATIEVAVPRQGVALLVLKPA
jgi:xylan 1,4-beta-xylosidase